MGNGRLVAGVACSSAAGLTPGRMGSGSGAGMPRGVLPGEPFGALPVAFLVGLVRAVFEGGLRAISIFDPGPGVPFALAPGRRDGGVGNAAILQLARDESRRLRALDEVAQVL